MSETKSCPICGNNCEWRGLDPLNSKEFYRCVTCGPFTITNYALPGVRGLSPTEKGLLSGVIRERTTHGGEVELWEKDIRPTLTMAPFDLLDRMDRLLCNLAQITTRFGQVLRFGSECSNLGYTLDNVEFNAQVANLGEQGFVKIASGDGAGGKRAVVLTSAGLRKAKDLRSQTGIDSNKVFVAMWFDASMEAVYTDGIAAGIMATGFDPMRVDKVEHNELIDDKIIVGLKECRFLVADYSGQRSGVYYEVGYVHGMGKTVIMCCNKTEMSGLHFDINHRNLILYSSPEELAEKLQLRILATVGHGANFKP